MAQSKLSASSHFSCCSVAKWCVSSYKPSQVLPALGPHEELPAPGLSPGPVCAKQAENVRPDPHFLHVSRAYNAGEPFSFRHKQDQDED